MLDLKGADARVGAEVARELHERGAGAAGPRVLAELAALAPFDGVPWVRTLRSARTRRELARLTASLSSPGPRAARAVRRLGAPLAADAGRRRRPAPGGVEVVMTWPVNDDAALDAVLALSDSGTTGVISDEPAVLRRVIAER